MLQDCRVAARVAFARAACIRGAGAVAVVITMATWVGCATWKSEPAPELARGGLPAARVADEAAILEIAFVRLPSPPAPAAQPPAEKPNEADGADAAAADAEVFWERMDETIVPSEMRRRLAENGIRVGRLLSIDPGQLEELVPAGESTRLLEEADVASDFEHRRRRISCRDGQPYTLAVRRPSGEDVSTLIRTEAGVVGRSLNDPQFMLIMRTRMLDDGRIAVRLVPEIQHGEVRQNWVGSDMAFRMDFQREKWTLEELMCEIPLSEGQAVVMMPSEETFGLGKRMFVGRHADLSQERIAVVVRLQRRPQHRIGS